MLFTCYLSYFIHIIMGFATLFYYFVTKFSSLNLTGFTIHLLLDLNLCGFTVCSFVFACVCSSIMCFLYLVLDSVCLM